MKEDEFYMLTYEYWGIIIKIYMNNNNRFLLYDQSTGLFFPNFHVLPQANYEARISELIGENNALT